LRRTMDDQIRITKQGFESLKKELDELMTVKRPKLVERLSYARSQGDLSENSDYINAKEELEFFLDGRISELQEVLKNAVVVSGSSKNGQASIGTKVTLKVDGEKHVCFYWDKSYLKSWRRKTCLSDSRRLGGRSHQ